MAFIYLVSLHFTVSLGLSCETIKAGAMLDVDTEPVGVVAPGDASPAERRVMWQHHPAAILDCFFDRIHHNLSQYN